MIELLSSGILTLSFLLFRNYSIFPEIMNTALSACTLFIIWGRFFLMTIRNHFWSVQKRVKLLGALYIAWIFIGSFGYLYFTNVPLPIPLVRSLQALVYGSSLVLLIIVKSYNLKECKVLGKIFITLQPLDICLILNLVGLDYYLTSSNMANCNTGIYLALGISWALTVINLLILRYRDYWYHKKIMMGVLHNRLKDNLVETIIIPPVRIIEEDPLYREIKWVLEYSFIRPLEMLSIIRKFKALLLAYGYSKETAITISGCFNSVIITNLMQREFDFSYIPTFWIRFYQQGFKFGRSTNRRRYY